MEAHHAESISFWDWWRILGRTEDFEDDVVRLPTLRIDPSLFLAGQTVMQQHVFMVEHAKDTQAQHKLNGRPLWL